MSDYMSGQSTEYDPACDKCGGDPALCKCYETEDEIMSDTPLTDAVVLEHSQLEEVGRVWYLSAEEALLEHAANSKSNSPSAMRRWRGVWRR